MTSSHYTADLTEEDAGGVHRNSGVNNKAAYLMTDGGTFNGRTITALGIPKVSRIYYAALTTCSHRRATTRISPAPSNRPATTLSARRGSPRRTAWRSPTPWPPSR